MSRRGAPVPVEKGVSDYATLVVGDTHPGKRETIAQWVDDRTEYVRNYKNSVYIGVGAIARKIAMQEVKVFRRITRKSGEILEPVKPSHPLRQLLIDVNPTMTDYDLWYYTVGWQILTGDAYWWKHRNGFRKPVELWPVPSQWVHVVPSPTRIIGHYELEGFFMNHEQVNVPVRDMVNIKEPSMDWSGTGRYYGTPAIKAGASTIDIESAMFERLYHSFKNYAPPGQIFTTDMRLTRDQLKQVYNQILSQHSRANQYGSPMITHSALKPMMQTGITSVREMDYSKSLDATMTLTLAILGVPKAVAGITTDVNRASMIGALISFCTNCINPRLVQIGRHLTQGLAKDFAPDNSLVVKFDLCTADDSEQIRKNVESMSRMGAVTPNEMREMLSSKQPFVTGGDRPVVNAGAGLADFGNVTEEELAAEREQKIREAQQMMAQTASAEENSDGDGSEDDDSRPEDESGDGAVQDS